MKNILLFRKSNVLLFWSLAFLFFLNTQVSWGQLSITGTGVANTHTQNFNSFAGTLVSVPTNWAWSYNDYNPGGFYNRNTTYSNSNSTYGLRDNSGSTDIAFGSKQDGAAYTLIFSIVNSTGADINGFELTWNVEQYSQCTNATPVAFAYRLNAAAYGLTGATGTGTAAFTSITGTCSNLASIAVTPKGLSITGITLATGGTANFRFTIGNTTSNNAHVGIDDFTIYATACSPQTIAPITASVTKSFGESHSIATTASSGLTVTYSSSNSSIATVAANGDVSIVGVGGPITLTASQAGNLPTVCAATSVTQSFTVTKATPTISVPPTASGITYGQTLASSSLTGGTASVAGTFTFTAPSTIPPAGTALYNVTFTPEDTTIYNTTTGTASVLINPKPLTITANDVSKPQGTSITGGTGSTAFTSSGLVSPQTIGSVTIAYGTGAELEATAGTYTDQVVASNATGGDFVASNYDITYLPGDITVSAGALIIGSSTTTPTFVSSTFGSVSNEASFTVTGNNMTEGILVTPPANFEVSLTSGGTFTNTVTVGGAGSIPTTTVYIRLKDTAPVGSYSGTITLSSADADNVTIPIASSAVSKATPTILVAPTAAPITYGQPLSAATLSGGSASVAGSFAFTAPLTIPPGGTASYSVTFTPTDTANYNNAIGTAGVTVAQASSNIAATGLLTFTYTGSPQGPDTSSVTGSAGIVTYTYSGVSPTSYGPSTSRPTLVGTYEVVADVAADTNYLAATSADFSFEITKANQTIAAITPASITKVIGDVPYSAATTASSALAIAYSSSNETVATVDSNGIVTILAIGTATITASQAGDTNFNAASSVTQSLTVGYPVLAGWDFTGLSGTATATATTFNTNLISTSGANTITRGPGALASSAANSFRTAGFQNNGIATSNTDYFQTTLTSTVGNILNLATITANLAGTGTFANSPGVSSQFAYSLNGTTFTLIGSPTVTIGTPASLSIDVSGISALQNVPAGTTVTFRYYASGQTTTGGWGFQSAATPGTNGLAYTGFFTKTPPTVTTNAATDLSSTSAVLKGTVNANGNATTASFDYGTLALATTPVSGAVSGTTNIPTSVSISGLSPNIQYTYRAIASGGLGGTVSGSNVSFYTLANTPSAPALTNATETTIDVAIGSGDGNPVGTLYAIQLNSGSYVQAGGASFGSAVWQTAAAWSTTTVINLNCNASASFTVYAKNGDDVVTSGTSASLSTAACTAPSLQADPLASFGALCINTSGTNSFALLGFNLTSAVAVNSLAGFTFSTDNSTFLNSVTLTPSGGGILETIYVRFTPTLVQSYNGAISITGGGLISSFDVIATGTGINTPATVTTGAVSAINIVSATITGTASPGCSAIIASGIEYSTASDFAGATQVAGAFPVTLSTLSPNTLYYVRAYVADSSAALIVYGTSTSFTTLALTTGPIADAATSIGATSFVANWQAVTGAESYLLDVSTSPTFGISLSNPNVTVLNNTGTIGASNWIETAISQQGSGSPYLGFLSSTSTSISPILNLSNFSNISLTFKARTFGGSSAAQAAITVSVSTDGVIWNSLGVNAPSSTSLTNPANAFSYNLSSYNSSTVRVRFQTLSATGTAGVGIDDIIVKGDETIITPSFIVENLQVAGLSQFVSGLSELTTYHYRVRAFSTNSTSPNSNVVSFTTAAAPPTFDSVSYVGSTVCDGANGTFDVAGLLPNVVSKIYYDIDGGTTQSILTTVADGSGAATFVIPLTLSANNTVLTITTVARADDSSSLTVESGGQVFLNFIAANVTYYSDADNDTFGDAAVTEASCTVVPVGFVSNSTDCDDNNNLVYQSNALYIDFDGDGWVFDNVTETVCYGATVPTGYVLVSLGIDCDDTDALLTNNCGGGFAVNLTMYVQGYYASGSTMTSVKLNQWDLVSAEPSALDVEDMTVELHDAVTYSLVDTAVGTLHTDGSLSVTFNTAAAGSYYIAVKGSNLVQTWSATPQAVGTTPLSYDFSSSASQAYGDNMFEVETGVFAFYSGDVDQNGNIDTPDYAQWETDYNEFASGVFATDLDGNGNVDTLDYTIWELNYNNFVSAVGPVAP